MTDLEIRYTSSAELIEKWGLSNALERVFERAGCHPHSAENLAEVLALTSSEHLKDWAELQGKDFINHPLTPGLTCSHLWETTWNTVSPELQNVWQTLAWFTGEFDLEQATRLAPTCHPRALAELVSHSVLFTKDPAHPRVQMWPGAQVWAQLRTNHQPEHPASPFVRACIYHARRLLDALEFGFLNQNTRQECQRHYRDLHFALELQKEANLDLPEVLDLATTCALLEYEALRLKDAVDLLQPLISNEDPTEPHLLRSSGAALRALAKSLAAAGLHESAAHHAQRAARLAEQDNDLKGQIRALYEEVCAHRAAGDAHVTLAALQRGLALARKGLDVAELARMTEIEAVVTHTFIGYTNAEPKHREALSLARSANLPTLEAYIIVHLANIYWREGDLIRARAALIVAEERQALAGDLRARGTTLTGLATVALDLGNLEEARHFASLASQQHRESGQMMPDGMALLLQCRIAVEEGDVMAAEQTFLEAVLGIPFQSSKQWQAKVEQTEIQIALLRNDLARVQTIITRTTNDTALHHIHAEMKLAGTLTHILNRNLNDAKMELDELTSILGSHSTDAEIISPLIPILQRMVCGDAFSSKDAIAAFQHIICPKAQSTHVGISSRLRFWIRRIEPLLSPQDRRDFWAKALVALKPGWVVDELLVLAPHSNEWMDLGRRPVPARIFNVLCELQWEDPVAVASDEELINHAWPGERLVAESATTRLQKAISDLRKMGLGDTLERHHNGYRIPPNVVIHRMPKSFDEWWTVHKQSQEGAQTFDLT